MWAISLQPGSCAVSETAQRTRSPPGRPCPKGQGSLRGWQHKISARARISMIIGLGTNLACRRQGHLRCLQRPRGRESASSGEGSISLERAGASSVQLSKTVGT